MRHADALSEFRPRGLLRCLEKIRLEHPRRADELAPPPSNEARERLRRLLLAASVSELPTLALKLEPVLFAAGVFLLADEDVGKKAEILLLSRPLRRVLRLAWPYLKLQYPQDRIETVSRALIRRFGAKDLKTGQLSADRIARWMLGRPRLPDGIVADWLELEVGSVSASRTNLAPQTPAQWLAEFGVVPDGPIAVATTHALLRGVDANLIRTLRPSFLTAMAAGASHAVREDFGLAVLKTLKQRIEGPWVHHIEWIVGADRFGMPPKENVPNHFWGRVSEESKQWIRRWINLRKLQQYLSRFDDEDSRFEFWRPLVAEHSIDVFLRCPEPGTFGPNRPHHAICIEFSSFGAIEFGRVGNAAYVYPINEFRKISRRRSSDPSEFKELWNTVGGGPNGDGRVVHRPGWRSDYAPWMSRLVRR